MDWRALIHEAYAARDPDVRPAFCEPATVEALVGLERALHVSAPEELRELLLQTNGLSEQMFLKGAWTTVHQPILSVEEMWERNECSRADTFQWGVDFSKILFFADAGVDGILFGHTVDAHGQGQSEVAVWHPTDGAIEVVAPSLGGFISGWISGTLKV